MKRNLLVICGPTATGKTSLALKLAKKFNGQIISADSRQVYKNMDVGTGKDLPRSAKLKTQMFFTKYYVVDGIKIWGYDLISPKRSYSVAHYSRFAKRVITTIWRENSLPILVGGTGLYIKSVIDGIDTANIPKNKAIRKAYKSQNASELYSILAQLDATKAASLNYSDKNNPRRLVRAIEIASYKPRNKTKKLIINKLLIIGLKANKELLKKIISKRVESRLKVGFIAEVKTLQKNGVNWQHQSMQALGYKQIKKYLEGKQSLKDFSEEWKVQEGKYAKKQMVWFKKDKRIVWFDIQNANYKSSVQAKIEGWIKEDL